MLSKAALWQLISELQVAMTFASGWRAQTDTRFNTLLTLTTERFNNLLTLKRNATIAALYYIKE